jgi:thioesterase domain-containing protein
MAATETRTFAQSFLHGPWEGDDPVPVGHAVLGCELAVVDEDGQELVAGEAGELVVRSTHLADGYQADPDRSRAAFSVLADGRSQYRTGDRGRIEADGLVFPLGRLDRMVKIRGFRVDLDEVERCVAMLPGVEQARAIALGVAGQDPALAVALVPTPAPERTVSLAGLRSALAGALPDYATPSVLVLVDDLPRNLNGKVDRRALEELLSQPGTAAPPERADGRPLAVSGQRDSLEAVITEAFSCSLGREDVGPDSDFFAEGGDSILALDLLACVSEAVGAPVTHPDLLAHPSPRSMARFIEDSRGRLDLIRPLREPAREHLPVLMLPAITGLSRSLLNLERLSKSGCDFHLLAPIAPDLADASGFSIATVAEQYAQRACEQFGRGPLALLGFSWGGIVAQELAVRLARRGVDVAHLVLLEASLPGRVLPRPRPPWRLWLDRARNFPAWARHDLLEASGQSLRIRMRGWAAGWVRGGSGREHPDLRTYFGRTGFSAEFEREFSLRYRAALDHTPQAYSGPTTVFRSSAQSLRDPRFGALGWEQFISPGPRTYTIPGHHESFLDSPHVERLVALLDGLLAAA